MAEPTSTSTVSIAALAVALLGPMAGPYALIVFAALAGALWPLSSAADGQTRMAGAWMLLRCMAMAVALTGSAAAWLQSVYNIAATEVLAPVAFVIGALGNGWRSVINSIGDAFKAIISRIGGHQQ